MKLLATGVVILISYSILVVQFYRASKKGYNSVTDVIVKQGRLMILNSRHLVSLIAMVAAALYVFYQNSDWLMLRIPDTKALLIMAVAAGAACAISVTAARKALKEVVFNSNVETPGRYIFLRASFLVVYELFFRGVLLNFCLAITSVAVAIVINVILYAIAHAFSTREELIGTVPFGILLCLLTFYSGSIWPAIVIHLLLGLPYDVSILSTPKRIIKTIRI
jgi:membrane protease YdiL (CAAX protease family)